MSFSSAVVAQSHYQGKVHAKNLRLKSFGLQAPGTSMTDFDPWITPAFIFGNMLNSFTQNRVVEVCVL